MKGRKCKTGRKISELKPPDNEKTSQSQRLRGFSCICKGFLACLFTHYLRYLQVIFRQNSVFADELQMKLQMKFGFKKGVLRYSLIFKLDLTKE